jgi:hypothetical protein
VWTLYRIFKAEYVQQKKSSKSPRTQRFSGRSSLKNIFPFKIPKNKTLRNEKIKIAHISYAYTLKPIAKHLKIHDITLQSHYIALPIHYITVSKIVEK